MSIIAKDLCHIIDENIRLTEENERLRKDMKAYREFLCDLVDTNQQTVGDVIKDLINASKDNLA